MKAKDEIEEMRQAVMMENYLSYKITSSLVGKMTPTREGIIRVLNQKRRKEGIYAEKSTNI